MCSRAVGNVRFSGGFGGFYESWSLPLAVILGGAVVLALLRHRRVVDSGKDVNIFVQIGLIVLVGLACKNAILIVEFAKQMHGEGKSVFEATQEASRLRLRPILMTSFAFIFGVIPLGVSQTGPGLKCAARWELPCSAECSA